MNIKQAILTKEKALAAISELVGILAELDGKVSIDEFEQIRKAVGLAIGSIEMHVNVPLYQRFPELEI
jgi:hypothetical protein